MNKSSGIVFYNSVAKCYPLFFTELRFFHWTEFLFFIKLIFYWAEFIFFIELSFLLLNWVFLLNCISDNVGPIRSTISAKASFIVTKIVRTCSDFIHAYTWIIHAFMHIHGLSIHSCIYMDYILGVCTPKYRNRRAQWGKIWAMEKLGPRYSKRS